MAECRLQYRGTVFPVRGAEVILGRSSYASIVVNNPLASREHAVVRRIGARLEVADLGSKNGTYVNGRRINGPHQVDVGDVIKIGTEAIEITQTSPLDPGAHRVATEPGRGSMADDDTETTVNFARSIELAESLIAACSTESLRANTAEAVAQLLGEYWNEHGPATGQDLVRVRAILRSLEGWGLEGSSGEWRRAFAERLER